MTELSGFSNYQLNWVRVGGATEQSWVDSVIFARAAYSDLMTESRIPGEPRLNT